MEHDPGGPAGSGEGQARRRQRKVLQAMLVPAVMAVGLVFAAKQFLGGATITTSPALAVIAAIAIGGFTLIGAIWHHRVIDEHEERAILWANTVGFYWLIAASFMAEILELGGIIGPVSHVMVLLSAVAASLGTYLWNQFR